MGKKASVQFQYLSRKPQRITITLPWSTYQSLLRASDQQGRSLSNVAAYWLEREAETWKRSHVT
ncbi:hypothetical protein CWE17_11205 [Synechococcus sp. BS56D]|nr:hypothetical protein CWE17_11205 [Synechococcus sp. BS56D]